ncbi:hypothetical protein GWG65_17420 [Bradyrhizobium sp. CSA207]|uniref:hypothetical protein n=1 Tax=Bradyrhizobium sp. CSA207 TaxID=2698826 RepID=UPI0023B04D44|nr:hypothetical protein [Bradyrhizobium sp. CSA207]MDE5443199.1 hypothetical protein [Bradyrhizobium sp. CSA207]
MDRDHLLNELLPYRMHAVETLNLALNLNTRWGAAPMTLYASDKLVVEGTLHGFTNPCIEAGMMHCRALLEFLGLCDKNGRLGNIKKRRSTDIGIEDFNTSSGAPLKKVSPADAAGRYPGPSGEAENALFAVFQVTNKGLAHVTENLNDSPEHARLIEIASRGTPVLMVGCFYKPMGLPAPNHKLTHRPHAD